MQTKDVTIVLGLDRSRDAARALLARVIPDLDPEGFWDYLLKVLNPRENLTVEDLRGIVLGAPDCPIRAVGGGIDIDSSAVPTTDGAFLGVLTVDTDTERFAFSNGRTGERVLFFRAKLPGARTAKGYFALKTTAERALVCLPRLRQSGEVLLAFEGGTLEKKTGKEAVAALSADDSAGDETQPTPTENATVGGLGEI